VEKFEKYDVVRCHTNYGHSNYNLIIGSVHIVEEGYYFSHRPSYLKLANNRLDQNDYDLVYSTDRFEKVNTNVLSPQLKHLYILYKLGVDHECQRKK